MTGHRKILIVSYAGTGHINPSLRFATCLLKLGVDVTFSTSLSVVQRLPKQPALTFAPFSDGHPDGKQPNTNLQQFLHDFQTHGSLVVAETILSAAEAGQPFDCLVYTIVIPWAARVAHAHGVKAALLWCQPATVLDIYYYYFNFTEYQELISRNNNNPNFPISLPSLPPLTIADLPSFLSSSSPKEHECLLPLIKDHIEVLQFAPRVLVNTVKELEMESIGAIQDLDYLLPIGPLIESDSLEIEKPDDDNDNDYDYLMWLNTKPKGSVVYVSFGTLASLSTEQLDEIAIGLVESGRDFLWVVRDIEEAERLKKKEELKLQKQGMIVGWCSQEEVLRHRAIGCFVTHGGWNSTVEGLAAGVGGSVVFPQWSDQMTNGKMIEEVWRTGVVVRRREGDEVVEGKEIKRCVEMVMENREMKRNAEKWKEVLREALDDGGSSTLNLQTFLNHV